ncbi:MAG: SoxR reducing system RseC family protein [Clostridia bacterium]|nr:SoxR reducing system RseC family protein [Clostridia bacterium]
MQQNATVIKTDGVYAVVEAVRSSACDGCHRAAEGCTACSLLGGKNTMQAKARNDAGAKEGDLVSVEASSGRTLFYAILVFLLPLLLAAAGYFAAFLAGGEEKIRIAAGAGGFLLAMIGVFLYSRLALAGRCDIRITEILCPAADREKDEGPDR